MTLDFNDIDPNRLAAVLYRPQDDIDTLLADFATDLLRCGRRLGGVVQRNVKDESGRLIGMAAVDLMSGRQISICQSLGSGAMACKLDPGGLAEAALAVTRAIAEEVDLIVVNKFSKQEAVGHGLRSELADAIVAGVPVLTAVPEKCLTAWTEFTADRGTTLLCARYVVDGWWQETSSRIARVRGGMAFAPDRAAATSRSSHPTI
jgi:molybdate transport system ATP-binding protein